jgi:hypothetical protein
MKTNLYKATWIDKRYGESGVNGNSLAEATENANKGNDFNFEELDPSGDWELVSVELIEEGVDKYYE